MTPNDEDSMFEQALKGDLPTAEEQARLRKRLFAAGLSLGSGLGATGTAAAQAGWGATVVAKVATLSWPMTLALSAAVATPIVALPIWRSPKQVSHAAPNVAKASPKPSATRATMIDPVIAAPERVTAPSPAVSASEPVRPAQRTASSGVATVVHSVAATSLPVSKPLPAVIAFSAPSSAVAAASAASVGSAASAPRASSLAAETQLLDRAFAEIAAGHRASAAALIAEHQRRFPNGVLSQERERARTRLEQSSQGE